MQFLEKFVLSPSPDHLLLLKILSVLLFLIHIPYVSVLFGSTLLSVVFQALDKREKNSLFLRFARDLRNLGIVNINSTVLLGFLPLLTLLFVFAQIYQRTNFAIANYLLVVLALATAGFAILHFYRSRFSQHDNGLPLHVGVAGLGLAFLLTAYFVLISSTTLILEPEEWPFMQAPFPAFFSANVIPRFLLFLTVVSCMTGLAILMYLTGPSEGKNSQDSEYRRFTRQFGSGLGLVSILLQPIFIFWNLYTLPDLALSGGLFFLWAVVLILLLFTALSLGTSLSISESESKIRPAVIFFLAFSFMAVGDQMAGSTANYEHEQSVSGPALEALSKLAAEREERIAAAGKIDAAPIFDKICAACHRFDQKVVGPSLNSVLPKYAGKPDALKAYLLSPTKQNPDFPPMPNPGLNNAQATAMAQYLLQKTQ